LSGVHRDHADDHHDAHKQRPHEASSLANDPSATVPLSVEAMPGSRADTRTRGVFARLQAGCVVRNLPDVAVGETQHKFIEPMLLRSGEPPVGEGWTYEVKWDGIRAVSALRRTDGVPALASRSALRRIP
jgi:hypothetical protein